MRTNLPKLSLLALSIYLHHVSASELNLDFIHGTKVIPSILNTNSQYPQGQYFVDVFVNNDGVGKAPLFISDKNEKENVLCLSHEWLKNANVPINTKEFESVFNKTNQCFELSRQKHTNVEFDYGTQSLRFDIPQAYLLSKTDPALWDYGTNGGRVRYYANFNKSTNNDWSAFGNTEFDFNIGRWVLSSNANISHSNKKTEITSSDLTLSTAISKIQGDLLIGKSQTRSELFSDFSFYGAALRSNENMIPWESRGYAPDISGVASTPSRITIKQNGYTIYSKMVPAGPYSLNDLRPSGNGDLVVTIEDESGYKTTRVYPVTTLPTLLRPGELKYNFAGGIKNNRNSKLNTAFSSDSLPFWFGSIDYGFSPITLNTAAIINNKYQAAGIGATKMLGHFGALSLSTSLSKASYDNGIEKTGRSFSAKYAKNFTDKTDLQLLTYRYQSKGYVEFADFDPKNNWSYGNKKSRYEARLSHRFDDMYLSSSYWRQNYWGHNGYDAGGTLSLSTSVFDSVSLFLNGGYTKNAWRPKSDYSASINVSIPFNIGEIAHYSNSSVGYSRFGGTTFNTSASATPTDRFNYSLSANTSTKHNRGASISASYAFDAVQTNLGLSQSKTPYSDSITSFSGGISGSIVGTQETGLLFTKEATKTIGVIHIPGVEGVKVNNSMPTNSHGNTVVWLTEYAQNHINIDMTNTPDNLEFQTTSYNVVPTEKAIIYRQFSANHVMRYILRIKNKQNAYLDGGNAYTEQGVDAGFIANNGVLVMNMLAAPTEITVNTAMGAQCKFSMSNIKPNTNKVQEVYCE